MTKSWKERDLLRYLPSDLLREIHRNLPRDLSRDLLRDLPRDLLRVYRHLLPHHSITFCHFYSTFGHSIKIHQNPSAFSVIRESQKVEHTNKQTDIRRYKQNNPTPGVGISYYPSSIIGTIYSSEILNYYDGTSAIY